MPASDLMREFLHAIESYRSLRQKLKNIQPIEIPKVLTEQTLYQFAKVLVKQLDIAIPSSRIKTSNSYHGFEHLLKHLKVLIRKYEAEHNQVTTLEQQAARALVLAIQLLSQNDYGKEITNKLMNCREAILTAGDKEQISTFNTALKAAEKNNADFPQKIFESLQIGELVPATKRPGSVTIK